MRNLIALFVASFVTLTASANAPAAARGAVPAPVSAPAAVPAAVPVSAPVPAKVEAAKSALESIKPMLQAPTPARSGASARALEDQAELELSTKIAARLALLRANQAARRDLAGKAKKQVPAKPLVLAPVVARGTYWSYEGVNGPANWGKINADWSQCGAGNRQSPIDIRDGIKVELEPIAFDYKPTSFSVTDNGHTIQVTLGGGNYITIQNRMYELVQFDFHRPSEERINGRGFEMAVHLMHRDPENRVAVIAVLLERGAAQSLIQTVWNHLPLEKNVAVTPAIVLDLNELLPPRRDYFTYMGSLTTPPCSEGVLWMVLKEPVQASAAQMALFSRLYPLNARPIQVSSGRMIKESN